MAGAFCVELQKAHRRHDLLFCLLVPLIVMLWTGSLLSPGPDELANAYSALFYSIPVANVLIFPIVMACKRKSIPRFARVTFLYGQEALYNSRRLVK